MVAGNLTPDIWATADSTYQSGSRVRGVDYYALSLVWVIGYPSQPQWQSASFHRRPAAGRGASLLCLLDAILSTAGTLVRVRDIAVAGGKTGLLRTNLVRQTQFLAAPIYGKVNRQQGSWRLTMF